MTALRKKTIKGKCPTVLIDATIVRAHQHAAGAKGGKKIMALRSQGSFSTKVHFAVSQDGYPLRFRITEGQSADIHEILPLLAQRAPNVVIADTA